MITLSNFVRSTPAAGTVTVNSTRTDGWGNPYTIRVFGLGILEGLLGVPEQPIEVGSAPCVEGDVEVVLDLSHYVLSGAIPTPVQLYAIVDEVGDGGMWIGELSNVLLAFAVDPTITVSAATRTHNEDKPDSVRFTVANLPAGGVVCVFYADTLGQVHIAGGFPDVDNTIIVNNYPATIRAILVCLCLLPTGQLGALLMSVEPPAGFAAPVSSYTQEGA